MGLAFGVCDVALKKQVNCKDLESRLVKGKIRKETVFRTLYDAAVSTGKTNVAKDIKEAAGFIHVRVKRRGPS